MSTSAELRHQIRGTLNAIKLCVSAFELPLDTSEKLAFLKDIERSAAKLTALVEELDLLPVTAVSPTPVEVATVVGHVR